MTAPAYSPEAAHLVGTFYAAALRLDGRMVYRGERIYRDARTAVTIAKLCAQACAGYGIKLPTP